MTHYGVEVILQQLSETSFKKVLEEKGVKYTELPVMEDVVEYEHNGIKKFAYIIHSADGLCETVFITTEVPKDLDWANLARDIIEQEKGEVPMKMQSRLKFFLDMAEDETRKDFLVKQENPVLAMLEGIKPEDEEYLKEVARHMVEYGYGPDRMRSADSWDVNQEFIEKIVNAM